jgi:hypothetical protein
MYVVHTSLSEKLNKSIKLRRKLKSPYALLWPFLPKRRFVEVSFVFVFLARPTTDYCLCCGHVIRLRNRRLGFESRKGFSGHHINSAVCNGLNMHCFCVYLRNKGMDRINVL